MVHSTLQNGEGTLILRPNRSATWAENKAIILALGFASLFIAVSWALVGAWLILPFAGLEIALVAYFLHLVSRKSHRQVIIRLAEEHVHVEQGILKPEQNWQLMRSDTFIQVQQPQHHLEGPTMTICAPEVQIDISSFLSKKDSEQLLNILKQSGLKLTRTNLDIVELKA